MNPDTGSFTSMDTYQGNIFDPASLNKYTISNNDFVMHEDVECVLCSDISRTGLTLSNDFQPVVAPNDFMCFDL